MSVQAVPTESKHSEPRNRLGQVEARRGAFLPLDEADLLLLVYRPEAPRQGGRDFDTSAGLLRGAERDARFG